MDEYLSLEIIGDVYTQLYLERQVTDNLNDQINNLKLRIKDLEHAILKDCQKMPPTGDYQ